MAKKIVFIIIVILGLVLVLKAQMNNDKKTKEDIGKTMSEVAIHPISHASLILAWGGFSIYIDPVDENKANIFEGRAHPDIVLITDIHGDHFDAEALNKIVTESTKIFAPKAVFDLMPEEMKSKVSIMNNGDVINELDFKIEAIPAYNLPGPSEQYHAKGRGNGYVIEKDGKRIYISGDTAGIPEMRALENIDIAFVAMNLPYTMSIDEAVSAVLEFEPKRVYPYHYRQRPTNDFADVAKFKEMVNSQNSNIEVIQLDWYPKAE